MTHPPRLSPDLAARVCAHLGVVDGPIGGAHLQRLIDGYARAIPWESASRIARRRAHSTSAACVRWPEEFWRDHFTNGTGGTCFETNYALFALLRALGYDGYLTVNDMEELHACHSACIIETDEGVFLVDVGIPLHAPIALDPSHATTATSPFHTYTLSPTSRGVYEVRRDRHPRPYIYTLVDRAVSDADYRAITINDFDRERGLFLDRIIVNKVVGGMQHRFCSGDLPWCIELFSAAGRSIVPLGTDPAGEVATHFAINPAVLRAAWPKG